MAKKAPTVSGLSLMRQAGSDEAVLARWKWGKSHTDHFNVQWLYLNKKGVWVIGSEESSDVTKVSGYYQSDWSIPTSVSASKVQVKVKPVSKTYKNKKKKTVSYWTAGWTSKSLSVDSTGGRPEAPQAPSCVVNVAGTQVNLSWSYDDTMATSVEVWRNVDGEGWSKLHSVSHGASDRMSYADKNVSRGHAYKYRLRAYNKNATQYGDYSDVTALVTPPQRPTNLKASVAAVDDNGGRVKLEWKDSGKQLGFAAVEYSTFNAWSANSDDYQTMELETTKDYVTVSGLETGRTWFFRLRRRNDAGYSYYAYLPGSSDSSENKYMTASVALAGVSKTYLPNRPTGLAASDVTPEAADEDAGQVLLTWSGPFGSGDSYEAQWTDVLANFENNAMGDIGSATVDFDDTDGSCRFTVTSLERGRTWWFRIRRKTEAGVTRWATTMTGESRESAEIARATIGAAPGQAEGEGLTSPTCGTTSTSYRVSDVIPLSWTHNSESSSVQTAWEVGLAVTDPDGTVRQLTVSGGAETALALDLSGAEVRAGDGTSVSWRVRTKGVDPALWSPWSRTQTFLCWADPVASAALSPLTDGVATSLPLSVAATASSGAEANSVVAWWAEVIAAEPYTTIGDDGADLNVAAGEVIWRRELSSIDDNFDSSSFSAVIAARDAPLQSDVPYELCVGCVTAQGMRAESSIDFSCAWELGPVAEPEASVTFDDDTMCAWVYPSCREYTGEEAQSEDGALVPNVTLSVFRIDDDGTTIQLASELENTGDYAVVDAHPSAGEQWYRIVATDPSTGAQNMVDQPVGCEIDRIVIQWDESWERIVEDDEVMVYGARTLLLPYDVRHDEEYGLDATLHEFIGRRWPVSRYGTQRGQSASWSVDVPRDDAETMSLLRQLAAWRGDCYVREPSGTGYWANVRVRISGGYDSSAASVQLTLKRVEPPAEG